MKKPVKREWLLFLVQLPATPSSPRVALWRRLRSAGSTSLINGAWVLPNGKEHVDLLAELSETVRSQGGSAMVFVSAALPSRDNKMILALFRRDRCQEYVEFHQRTETFLAEVANETRLEKFTFAELEELEDDLQKLSTWLERIRARDFFAGEEARKANKTLKSCTAALGGFAQKVYVREGVSAQPGNKA